MKFQVKMKHALGTAASVAVLAVSVAALAQDAAPAAAGRAGRGGNAAPKRFWVEKMNAGAYKAPMRPLWKLSDLKAMHPGQHTWSTQIIKDSYQDVTYQSAAPGTKLSPRLHPNTPEEIVVIGGQVIFNIEGQQPITAKRGSVVLVPAQTVYSYEATGSEDALFVDINVLDYQTLYPSTEPEPKAMAGGKVIQIGYSNQPQPYANGNVPHWNLFDQLASCTPLGRVRVDHIQSSPLLGYSNAADIKCTTGRGSTPAPKPMPIDTKGTTFGHMHKGPAEWWIVQVGQIQGNFENQGTFLANEGDVLYAQPDMWHQMYTYAPSGPSVRFATYGANGPNLTNTAGGGGGGD